MSWLFPDSEDEAIEAEMSGFDDFDIAMEGAISDAFRKQIGAMKEIKPHKAAMKAAIRSRDFKTAATEAEACADTLEAAASEISKLEPSMVSNIIVDIAYFACIELFQIVVTKVAMGTAKKSITKEYAKLDSEVMSGQHDLKPATLSALHHNMDVSQLKTANGGTLSEKQLKKFDQLQVAYNEARKVSEALSKGKPVNPVEVGRLAQSKITHDMKIDSERKAGRATKGALAATTAMNAFSAIFSRVKRMKMAKKGEISQAETNALCQSCIKALRDGAKAYRIRAVEYRSMIRQPASECWLFADAAQEGFFSNIKAGMAANREKALKNKEISEYFYEMESILEKIEWWKPEPILKYYVQYCSDKIVPGGASAMNKILARFDELELNQKNPRIYRVEGYLFVGSEPVDGDDSPVVVLPTKANIDAGNRGDISSVRIEETYSMEGLLLDICNEYAVRKYAEAHPESAQEGFISNMRDKAKARKAESDRKWERTKEIDKYYGDCQEIVDKIDWGSHPEQLIAQFVKYCSDELIEKGASNQLMQIIMRNAAKLDGCGTNHKIIKVAGYAFIMADENQYEDTRRLIMPTVKNLEHAKKGQFESIYAEEFDMSNSESIYDRICMAYAEKKYAEVHSDAANECWLFNGPAQEGLFSSMKAKKEARQKRQLDTYTTMINVNSTDMVKQFLEITFKDDGHLLQYLKDGKIFLEDHRHKFGVDPKVYEVKCYDGIWYGEDRDPVGMPIIYLPPIRNPKKLVAFNRGKMAEVIAEYKSTHPKYEQKQSDLYKKIEKEYNSYLKAVWSEFDKALRKETVIPSGQYTSEEAVYTDMAKKCNAFMQQFKKNSAFVKFITYVVNICKSKETLHTAYDVFLVPDGEEAESVSELMSTLNVTKSEYLNGDGVYHVEFCDGMQSTRLFYCEVISSAVFEYITTVFKNYISWSAENSYDGDEGLVGEWRITCATGANESDVVSSMGELEKAQAFVSAWLECHSEDMEPLYGAEADEQIKAFRAEHVQEELLEDPEYRDPHEERHCGRLTYLVEVKPDSTNVTIPVCWLNRNTTVEYGSKEIEESLARYYDAAVQPQEEVITEPAQEGLFSAMGKLFDIAKAKKPTSVISNPKSDRQRTTTIESFNKALANFYQAYKEADPKIGVYPTYKKGLISGKRAEEILSTYTCPDDQTYTVDSMNGAYYGYTTYDDGAVVSLVLPVNGDGPFVIRADWMTDTYENANIFPKARIEAVAFAVKLAEKVYLPIRKMVGDNAMGTRSSAANPMFDEYEDFVGMTEGELAIVNYDMGEYIQNLASGVDENNMWNLLDQCDREFAKQFKASKFGRTFCVFGDGDKYEGYVGIATIDHYDYLKKIHCVIESDMSAAQEGLFDAFKSKPRELPESVKAYTAERQKNAKVFSEIETYFPDVEEAACRFLMYHLVKSKAKPMNERDGVQFCMNYMYQVFEENDHLGVQVLSGGGFGLVALYDCRSFQDRNRHIMKMYVPMTNGKVESYNYIDIVLKYADEFRKQLAAKPATESWAQDLAKKSLSKSNQIFVPKRVKEKQSETRKDLNMKTKQIIQSCPDRKKLFSVTAQAIRGQKGWNVGADAKSQCEEIAARQMKNSDRISADVMNYNDLYYVVVHTKEDGYDEWVMYIPQVAGVKTRNIHQAAREIAAVQMDGKGGSLPSLESQITFG